VGVMGDTRALEQIVELALATTDPREFRACLLDLLGDLVGFEKGSLHRFRLGGGVDTTARGYDHPEAFQDLARYMSELEPHEIAAASGDRPIVDTEALSMARRDRLAFYHQILRPERITVFATVMWRADDGASGLNLARTGRGARFSAGELERLQRLLPIIRLSEAYVALRAGIGEPMSFGAWAEHVGLTRREREVARLIVRGLTNREAALLLGNSVNTVRNHLASVFEKAHVATRTELVHVSTSFQPACEAPPWLGHLQ
jgi:DNA-binding CsgD family transcriptional regulator